MNMPVRSVVNEADFDVAAEYRAQRERTAGSAGAIAMFAGLVRDRHADDDVAVLELEHYPGMTERSIETIVDDAARRWPLLDVTVIHRVGRILANEQIVLVLVASAHRAAAFAACEFLMDYLKTDAVFWKREVRAGGTHWIESTSEDHTRRLGWDKPDQ
jgi:molybdopterin synthase catalytic subunit